MGKPTGFMEYDRENAYIFPRITIFLNIREYII